jgi:hypothetical protein
MYIKSLLMKSIFKFSAVCGLTIAIIFSSANLAKAESREEAVRNLTDWFFYEVNPQLNNRPLRLDEYNYIDEWQAIYKAVNQEMEYSQFDCAGDNFWALYNYDLLGQGDKGLVSSSFNHIADAIFYSRNPQLIGYKIADPESEKAREWLIIRRSIIREHPCY